MEAHCIELGSSQGIYHRMVMISLLLATFHFRHVNADDRIVNKKTIAVGGDKDEAGFTADERFQDIFQITEDNFKERVWDSSEPWIVLFHDGMVNREWKSLAVAMRGIVWFGSIHRLEQEDLIDEIKYPLDKSPPARVYPWGSPWLKKKWTDVIEAEEAKRMIIDSMPDPSTKVVTNEIHNFLFDSYSSVPSRLPVIFFVESDELTPLFKAVGLRYNKYFHFGTIRNPTKDDLAVFQYSLGFPGIVILVTDDFAKEPERSTPNYDFQAISYSTEKQGILNYSNVLRFLYSVNHKFRATLPGMNLAEEEEILQMEEELDMEKERFNVQFLDKIKEIATFKPFGIKTTSSMKVGVKKTNSSSKEKGKKKGKENVATEEVLEEKYEERKQFGKKSKKVLADTNSKEEL